MDDEMSRAILDGNLRRLRAALRARLAGVHAVDDEGRTLLMLAITGPEVWAPKVADALVKVGIDVNACDKAGKTALALAVASEPLQDEGEVAAVVRFLLKRGADPNLADEDGWTPLMESVSMADPDEDVVLALIKAGADPNRATKDEMTAVAIAREGGDEDLLGWLGARGSGPA